MSDIGSNGFELPPPPIPEEDQPPRIRLRDLPTPPEVVEEAKWWCAQYSGWPRKDVEESLKLQYYYGGQHIYEISTREGTVVVPIPERYLDMPGLRYALLKPAERDGACFTIPDRWHDDTSRIS